MYLIDTNKCFYNNVDLNFQILNIFHHFAWQAAALCYIQPKLLSNPSLSVSNNDKVPTDSSS